MLSSLKRSNKWFGILKLLEHQCWSNISVNGLFHCGWK